MTRFLVCLLAFIGLLVEAGCGKPNELTRPIAERALAQHFTTLPALEAVFSEGYWCNSKTPDPLHSPRGQELFTIQLLAVPHTLREPYLELQDVRDLEPFSGSRLFGDTNTYGCNGFFHDRVRKVVLTRLGREAAKTWSQKPGPSGYRPGTTETTWGIPLATRVVSEITGVIRQKDSVEATVEFTWNWVPTQTAIDLGYGLDSLMLIYNQYPKLERFMNDEMFQKAPRLNPVHADAAPISETLNAIRELRVAGSASFRLYDDGWRLVPERVVLEKQ